MSDTYLDYYGAVFPTEGQVIKGVSFGLNGEKTGTFEASPPATTSIDPSETNLELHEGATFFHDFTWLFDGTPVDLTDWVLTASIYDTTNTELFALTQASGIIIGTSTGRYRIELTDEETETIDFTTAGCGNFITLAYEIDAERMNSKDPLTGYEPGQVARIEFGPIRAFSRAAG